VARKLKTQLLIFGLQALTWLAGIVPRYPHAEILCRIAGLAWYACAPSARAAVEDNLRHIYRRAPRRIKVLRVFQNGALNYWDTFAIGHLRPSELIALVDLHGRERLDDALAGGAGVIVASAHLGSVALVAQIVPALGYPTTGLLEPIEPPELFEFFAGQRRRHGIRLLPVGTAGLRELLAALRRNEVVGLITDREFGSNGVVVDFFGTPARFAEGVAALSLRTGAPILIAACARKPGGRFDAWIESLPLVLTGGDQKQNIRAISQAVARRLEYYVANNPAQWTVFQQRWQLSQRKEQ
jgi:lauroyl/myristoyl acyltransferase